jgi:O-antigen/teichoic acid export membrane protein
MTITPGIATAVTAPPLRGMLVRGSAWMVAMRLSVRALGFVNTVVLARLLVPEDFGVVALAMLVAGTIEVFFDVGLDVSLIRRPDAGRSEFDTAWTLRVLLGLTLAALTALLAAPTAAYFEDPRLTPLMYVLAIKPVLEGIENPGIVWFRKDLDFAREFRFQVLARGATLLVSIGAAFLLRNYWALAIGTVGQAATNSLMSYRLHPYRPRPSLAARAGLVPDSLWLLLRTLAFAVRERIDQFAVGRLGGAGALGGYFLAKSVAQLLTVELALPVGRAVLPGFARLLAEPERLANAYLKMLTAVAFLATALGLGLHVVAADFVAVAFGASWVGVVPYLEVFALAGAFYGVQTAVATLLTAIGRLRALAILATAQTVALGGVLLALVGTRDPLLLAHGVVLVEALGLVAALVLSSRLTGVSLESIGTALGRPAASGMIMLGVLELLHGAVAVGTPLARLPLDVAVGVVTFLAATLLIWQLSGRPDGPERMVLEALGERWARRPRG